MIAFIALAALGMQPDYSDYNEVVSEKVAITQDIKKVQVQCESLLMRYTSYSRQNRKYLATTAWDLPKGWVDPTSINDSRKAFQRISITLRDEIDLIQRSAYPRVKDCKVAYDQAMYDHQRLLKPMLYNGR